MQVTIRGKNTDVGSRLKAHTEAKLAKMERYDGRIVAMEVEFSEERNPRVAEAHRVEVTCRTNSHLIRAEANGPDPATAIDSVLPRLERQVKKLKDRTHHRPHHGESRPVAEPEPVAPELVPAVDLSDAYESRIVRSKRVELTPMTAGEAAMKMDLLGFDFYLFENIATGRPAVVYRRRNDDFGLIGPEVAGEA